MNTFFTFDFFDTIFFRKHGSFESFLYNFGAYLIENELIELSHPRQFVQKRLLIEKEASSYFRKADETLAPNLNQIYSFYFSEIGSNKNKVDYAMLEFIFEKKHGFIPFFIQNYIEDLLSDKQGLAIISNSYYSADQIIELLLQCSSLPKDLISKIDVFTSSDRKTNKQKKLFYLVKQDLTKKHGNVHLIHTGDNYELDVSQPQKHGFYSIHSIIPSLPKIEDTLRQKKLTTPEVTKLLSSRYLVREFPLYMHKKIEFASCVVVPAIYVFCDFILGNSIFNSKLFFLEREGVQLQKLYEEYCMVNGNNILCESLPVSRYALSPVTILSNDKKLVEGAIKRIIEKTGSSYNEALSLFEEKVDSVLDFLDKKFEDGKNYTLVDFGYKGSISVLIEIALRHLKKKCIIRTLLVFNDPGVDCSIDLRALFDQKILGTSVIGSAGGAIGLFEELFMPDFGSTIGYEGSKAIHDHYLISEQQKKEKSILINYMKKLIRMLALQKYQVQNNDLNSLNQIFLNTFSNIDFIHAFSDWSHEINMGSKSIIQLFPSIRELEGLLISEKKIREIPSPKHLIRSQLKDYKVYTYSGRFIFTVDGQKYPLVIRDKYYFPNIKPIALIDLNFELYKLNKVTELLLKCPVKFSGRINKIELFVKKISNGSRAIENYRCELKANNSIKYLDFSVNLGLDSISINLYSNKFLILECVVF